MLGPELKARLILLGILYLAYVVVPGGVGAFMGQSDLLFAHVSVSLLFKAGLGAVLAYRLVRLHEPLSGLLEARLSGALGVGQEPVREISRQGALFGTLSAATFLVAPVVEDLLRQPRLLMLLKLGLLGYCCWLAYRVWTLMESAISSRQGGPPA